MGCAGGNQFSFAALFAAWGRNVSCLSAASGCIPATAEVPPLSLGFLDLRTLFVDHWSILLLSSVMEGQVAVRIKVHITVDAEASVDGNSLIKDVDLAMDQWIMLQQVV